MRRIPAWLLVVALAATAQAAVWHVEKDGSGDFSVIQDAINVAAAGDTIRIGPGRYDEKRLIGNPPWQQYARLYVLQSDITIIGAGMTQTIIGPATPYTESQGGDFGIAIGGYSGATVARIYSLRLENVNSAMYVGNDVDTIMVRDCSFRGNIVSCDLQSEFAKVSNCQFESLAEFWSNHVISLGVGELKISDCEFEIDMQPRHPKIHIHIQSTDRATVSRCDFTGGTTGMVVTMGSEVEVHHCRFDGQSLYGLANDGPGTFTVEDCEITNQSSALYQYGSDAFWAVERVHFENVSNATLAYVNLYGGYIRNCTLARGPRYVVMDLSSAEWPGREPATVDMTNNWWGTSDPDSIQAWIYDSNDQPTRPYYYIQWDPYRTEPMAAEKRSLGGVKALFR